MPIPAYLRNGEPWRGTTFNQYGFGVLKDMAYGDIYRPMKRRQRGHGFGTMFAALAKKILPVVAKVGRKAIPIAKKAAKRAANEALKEGARQLPQILLAGNKKAGVKRLAHNIGNKAFKAAVTEVIKPNRRKNTKRRRRRRGR